MKIYKLKKWYPSLPKSWKEGMKVIESIHYNITVYENIDDKYKKLYIDKKNVENNPEFWEKTLNYSIEKWYKTNCNELFYITDIVNDHIIGYGLSTLNTWIYKINFYITKDKEIILEEATEKEVKDRLLQYAKENYPEGSILSNRSVISQKYITIINLNTNYLVQIGNSTIYSQGIWTKVIEKSLFKDKNNNYWYESDFKKNKVYYIDGYIMKFDKLKLNKIIDFNTFIAKSYIKIDNSIFGTNPSSQCFRNFKSINTIRNATQDQIKWLERCEKAGKFVNREKPMYNYKKELKAFKKLLIIRDEIREGWEPDYNTPRRDYFAIILNNNEWENYECSFFNEIFVFQTEEKRSKFLKENRKLLEKIKLLYK